MTLKQFRKIRDEKGWAIHQALRELGAIGHGNPKSREIVRRHANRLLREEGVCELSPREVRGFCNLTRGKEAMRERPEDAILFTTQGIFLPAIGRESMLTDFRKCSDTITALIGDMPEQVSRIEDQIVFLRNSDDNGEKQTKLGLKEVA